RVEQRPGERDDHVPLEPPAVPGEPPQPARLMGWPRPGDWALLLAAPVLAAPVSASSVAQCHSASLASVPCCDPGHSKPNFSNTGETYFISRANDFFRLAGSSARASRDPGVPASSACGPFNSG